MLSCPRFLVFAQFSLMTSYPIHYDAIICLFFLYVNKVCRVIILNKHLEGIFFKWLWLSCWWWKVNVGGWKRGVNSDPSLAMCLRKLWNQKRKIGFQRRSWHKRQCNEWCEDEHSSSSPVFNAMISCFVEPLTPYGVVCSRHECYERACGRFHFSKMVQTSGSWPFLYHDSLL